ncbi:MAG TPA: hypothetical protein VF785_13730 [Gemmatimonadaceae bacterium]
MSERSAIVRRNGLTKATLALSGLLATLLSACSASFMVGDCVSIGAPALSISAIDSRDHHSVLGGATIIVVHNGVRDSVSLPSSYSQAEYVAGFAESGSFIVIIRHLGFQEATTNEILVKTDRCGHPRTAFLTIVLST